MNTYLTMKELKEALPEIPENSLKRYIQELKGTIEEIRQTLVNENERETEIEVLFRDSLLATQKSIEEVASSIEVKKNKGLWLLQIKDFFLRSIKLKKP